MECYITTSTTSQPATTNATTPPTTTKPGTVKPTTKPPTPNTKCPAHSPFLERVGDKAVGKVSGKSIDLNNCERASDPLNKPRSPIEDWFTKDLWDNFFYKSNLGFGPHACLPYSYEAFIISARYFPDFGNEYFTHTPDGKPMPQGFTEEETKRRDVAGFFAHMVQETGENNEWILTNYKGFGLTWDEAQECYMKGALWTWLEGGGDGTGGTKFPCGDHPSCGDFSQPAASSSLKYCSTWDYHNQLGMKCSTRTDNRGYEVSYAGRGPVQTSWNYNYGMFARWAYEVGIRDENGNELDLVNYPNLLLTKMDPPLGFMASMWFYMTAANGHPSMHSSIVGNWVGYGKWTGAVFGPSSKLINNECQGESKVEGEMGKKESRRIKAFRFFTQYFGTRALGDGEDETSLSCLGFDYSKINPGAMKGWDFDGSLWAEPKPWPCRCAPVAHAGVFRYHDPKFAHSSPLLK